MRSTSTGTNGDRSKRSRLTIARAAEPLVSDVMTTKVYVVRPSMSIESATWLLLERGLSGAPVVDPVLGLVGFLSMTDLVREAHERGETEESSNRKELPGGFFAVELARATVGEVMSPQVLALHASCPLRMAAALMAHDGIHRVPIVSEHRAVVGMLSSLDVLAWLGQAAGYLPRPRPPSSWSLPARGRIPIRTRAFSQPPA